MTDDQTADADTTITFHLDTKKRYTFAGKECTVLEILEAQFGARGSGAWSMNHSFTPSRLSFASHIKAMEWKLCYG